MMKLYPDKSGNSGVRAYECGEDFILVLFRHDDEVYRYSYASAGREHVERMKELAEKGKGLATYINRYTSEHFEK